MTGNEYQKEALRTASENCRSLANCGLGITGEAGEVADLIKKHLFQGHMLDKKRVIEELGDVAWYMAVCAYMVNTPLDDVLQNNVYKLRKRYPYGFSEERSVNRQEVKE